MGNLSRPDLDAVVTGQVTDPVDLALVLAADTEAAPDLLHIARAALGHRD